MSNSRSKRGVLKWVETKPLGVNTLRLTCPQCGTPYWIQCHDGWECAACGEFVYPESLGVEVKDARAEVTELKEETLPTADAVSMPEPITEVKGMSPPFPSAKPAPWSTSIMSRFMRVM